MTAPTGQRPDPSGDRGGFPPGNGSPARGVERIALAGSVAVLRDGSIAIRPSRARLIGPAVEAVIAAAAVLAIVILLDVLSLWVLVLLLLVAMLLGPISVLGLVYNVAGSAVLVEREKRSVRYQQGLLGLGLGTAELVPFWRIARIELRGSDDEPLTSGERQDLVEWEVRLVKDNDRVLPVASALAPRPLRGEALARASRLARALAEMTGAPLDAPDDPGAGSDEHSPEPGAAEGTGRQRRRRRAV